MSFAIRDDDYHVLNRGDNDDPPNKQNVRDYIATESRSFAQDEVLRNELLKI